MLNFGYYLLRNIVHGGIVAHHLNPYFGFMHADDINHDTLASDLMEEWRAVIVDSTVMSLINGNEILPEHFTTNEDGSCTMTREGIKIFVKKIEKKFSTKTKYLPYIDFSVSFREAIGLQSGRLAKAIDKNDILWYNGVRIR
jgi:CRISPR-associated protein Cas1